MTDLRSNKALIPLILKIGLPIAIQNFIGTALNLVDNVMIGSRGEAALAAVSVSNRVFFIMAIILFGVYSGLGIYTSQYWGQKDVVSIRKIMGIGLTIGISISVLFTFLTIAFPSQIISIFLRDPEVITNGTDYLSIAVFTYIPVAIIFAFSYTSRSVHQARIPMISSIIALSINTLLNYVLINGNWGFPEMGVRGAAIATLIARLIELFILLTIIYLGQSNPLAGKISEFFSYTKEMFTKVIKTALPVIINETAWVIGSSVYFIAYGLLGTASVAAAQVSMTISDLVWTFLLGMGSATAVIVGNELGAGKVDDAYSIAKRLISMEFIVSIFLAVIFASMGRYISGFFNLTQSTRQLAIYCIYVNVAYLPLKLLGFVYIVGILRSGGDTKFCMLLDILVVWFVGIPLSFLSVLVFKLPIHWTIALVMSSEFLKVIIAHKRFHSRKWINVLV